MGALLCAPLLAPPAAARVADGFAGVRLLIGGQLQSDPRAPLATAAGFARCPQFFADGVAPATRGERQRALCYDAFAVQHSGLTRTPVYVATFMDRASLDAAQDVKRARRFFADARLPRSERAELADYSGSGWTRGHLAEAAAMPSKEGMAQSFSLANIVPQAAENNSRAWARIEADTRRYAQRSRSGIYVISGPAYVGERIETIGDNRVWVPTHLFKLVYDPAKNRAWAHWIANRDDARPTRPLRYSEFRALTGIDWFPGRPVAD